MLFDSVDIICRGSATSTQTQLSPETKTVDVTKKGIMTKKATTLALRAMRALCAFEWKPGFSVTVQHATYGVKQCTQKRE